ncbi:hypothetical protein WMW72_11990 [Paenibacillus filicis]|uniref:Cyclic lactone autoinducer peptide n=1 Tax=Paenibacillus filicis TaxID=669464 RepID=A0ABU9DIE3_9BACL
MIKAIAKYSSAALGLAALVLFVTDKFPLGDKHAPEALRKK